MSGAGLPPLPPQDRLRCFDLTSDVGVPVVLWVGQGPSRAGALLYAGSACHPSRELALRKALREALASRVYVRSLLASAEPPWYRGDDAANRVTDFRRHAAFYSRRPELVVPAFAFLAAAETAARPLEPDPSGVALQLVCERLLARGITPRVFDLSQPWMARLGLVVLRAVMPELLPLHGHHLLPHLGHPRLTGERPVSTFPHPFA